MVFIRLLKCTVVDPKIRNVTLVTLQNVTYIVLSDYIQLFFHKSSHLTIKEKEKKNL